ncbi:MAG: outer membrane lipoprotein carrier protein LolA [Thermoanaerobaculia bacterium]
MSKLLKVGVTGVLTALVLEALTPAASALDPRRQGLTPSERLQALVDRVRLEQSKLETLEAEFTQLKQSSMLLEPSVSKGVFSYAAPDRVRWEYKTPNPISMLIFGEEMTTWYRDIGQAEKVRVGRHSQRVLQLLGAGSSVSELLEYFSVSLTLPKDRSRPYMLELKPRFRRVAKRLRGMSLWIDPQLYLPIRLRYLEPDGDVTEYSFSNLRINGELPEDRFRLELPRSVKVKFVDFDRRAGLL